MVDLWSTRDLLTRLCQNSERSPSQVKEKYLRAYTILLKMQPDVFVKGKTKERINGTAVDGLLAEAFRMNCFRMIDRASELREITNRLMTHYQDNVDIENCLRFLLRLSNWDSIEQNTLSGQWIIPLVQTKKPLLHHFRIPPLYGDSSAYNHSFCYTHYPSSLFEKVEKLASPEEFNPVIFEKLPDFHCKEEPCLGFTLFGAVRHSFIEGPGQMINLAIPVLNETASLNPMMNTIKGNQKYSEISPDEGFVDEIKVEEQQSDDPTAIWENICSLNVKLRKYISWEHRIGPPCLLKEERFLCQSGPKGLDNSYKRYLKSLHLLSGSSVPLPNYSVSPHLQLHQFIKDVIHVLLGVASETFPYDAETGRFVLKNRLEGTTFQALTNLMEDFLDCGSMYLGLDTFSISSPLSSLNKSGYVIQCFKEGLRDFLQQYRGFILHAGDVCSETLLSLHLYISGAHRQLCFLKDVCAGERMSNLRTSFPRGLNLVSFLYEQALHDWGGANSHLLLYLFRCALKPYLAFLRGWIFQGRCLDPHSEFDIQINEHYLSDTYNDHFWTKGYILKESDRNKPFLEDDLRRAILICGRSLNLLKMCCPKHYLFDCGLQKQPDLALFFTDSETSEIKAQSEIYYQKVENILQEARELKKREKLEIRKVDKENVDSIESKLPGKIISSTVENSHPESDEMLKVRPNREKAEDEVQDFSEDKEFLAMEKILKKEMIEEFKKLESRADRQKEVLEWQAKRFNLHSERMEVLRSQDTKETTETSNDIRSPVLISSQQDSEQAVAASVKSNSTEETSDIKTANESPSVCSEEIRNEEMKCEFAIAAGISNESIKDSEEERESELESSEVVSPIESEDKPVVDCAGLSAKALVESDPESNLNVPENCEVGEKEELKNMPKYETKAYPVYFDCFDEFPGGNLVSSFQSFQIDGIKDDSLESFRYTPLPILIKKSLYPVMFAQIKLVNRATLDYFIEDLHLYQHFAALRNYFFFQDGEFGHALSQLVFEKVSTVAPCFLTSFDLMAMLDAAQLASVYALGDSLALANNLSFMAEEMTTPGFGSVRSFHLKYKVPWPTNLIITDLNLTEYDQIFGLLMLVKQALWMLNDARYRLKQDDCKLKGISRSPIFRKIQLFRHEMLHLVRSIQAHLCCQLLQLSWTEFLNKLQNDCQNLEDLRFTHREYLQKALKRCLLLPEDGEMLKNLKICFDKILLFRSLVISFPWQTSLQQESFAKIVTMQKGFKKRAHRLYEALKISLNRRFQQHVLDFIVCFDFNGYYEREMLKTRSKK